MVVYGQIADNSRILHIIKNNRGYKLRAKLQKNNI